VNKWEEEEERERKKKVPVVKRFLSEQINID
jgi:hypothetical protein